ncbi:PfkB family carbohydrate kinase [Enterobacter cloacae]|uniref:PfkB family carbohydrate kinase n=1 Tax=Enterobacter cloacae TaxID=550 RepID=UPI000735389D|nr:PfkB family carbohydrate kinase [Enterobacter cloacae]KTH76262.1 nucleoside 2-deoxyribosyltransferase [Enterobacter cloacae subsp. cloacae]KVJ35640.1 nucleoside 2-deoxyribosyltransferase [Enterobacter cloacae subsp. cloacae]MCM2486927.1 PfkB family carbohydrate kinase [Enterobacter cloacae]MCM7136740.1 PfkB family carbohydrate kinase [Enterobacter cloacae]MCU6250055.1 nucleoside 2-deoxyribosyltransferase [Enterobacter cloacae]
MITVVGGVYRERCMRPAWDDIYGSAGRAATAISRFGGQVELHACFDNDTKVVLDARATFEGFDLNPTITDSNFTFEYIHGLSTPDVLGEKKANFKIEISSEKVLRFGMIDGTSVVNAKYAVFDPQNADCPESFKSNGSTAEHLALVLNRYEANLLIPDSNMLSVKELAIQLAKQEGAEVVVIKMGPQGALIYEQGNITTVPAYRTQKVWKIGSGDTFAAHFALGWMDNGLSAHAAAELASIATAFYCEHQGFPDQELLRNYSPEPLAPSTRYCSGYIPNVYLAGPFFTLAELWMVGQARRDLLAMGLEVFSPYHEVGIGSAEEVVEKDLEGIRNCDVLFAIGDGLDSGTIYEIGYARALDKPVIFYAENESIQAKKMMEGSNCYITDDYVSAIYHTVWEAITQ